jgi:transcription antitermination factor NusG
MPEAWYAVYTKFQHEKSAARLLASKNVHVFLPVYRTVHRWKDRNQTVVLPLFPCYVFVRMTLEHKLAVLQTAGVRWLLENTGRACPVPDEEVESIRKVCSQETRIQPHPFLKQGDPVRVRTGALAGMEGILVRTKNQYRVVLTVDLLQKGVAVEVDLWNVEALHRHGGARRLNSDIPQGSTRPA